MPYSDNQFHAMKIEGATVGSSTFRIFVYRQNRPLAGIRMLMTIFKMGLKDRGYTPVIGADALHGFKKR